MEILVLYEKHGDRYINFDPVKFPNSLKRIILERLEDGYYDDMSQEKLDNLKTKIIPGTFDDHYKFLLSRRNFEYEDLLVEPVEE